MGDRVLYYIGFSYCLGIGPLRFKALINHFQSVEKAYKAEREELELVIGKNLATNFIQFRQRFDPVKKLKEIKDKNIQVLCFDDPSYPSRLKNISDPPICLYTKGEVKNFNQDYLLAIIGTRKPSFYGQQIAKKFSYELTRAGFVIVSGMAIGIDTIAHQNCLEADGKTIAVLGCGVDIIYPSVNTKLYREIIKKGGLIISEFPPGHTVLKGLFIARNRLISGLAKGVLVVEGAKDSGALITADYAAQQGREVFAPPGPLTSKMSEAPNILLKQGAKLVTSVADILEEFNLRVVSKKREELQHQLNKQEKLVFEALLSEAKSADDLAILAKMSVDKVLNILSILEIGGLIEKNNEGKYQIKI